MGKRGRWWKDILRWPSQQKGCRFCSVPTRFERYVEEFVRLKRDSLLLENAMPGRRSVNFKVDFIFKIDVGGFEVA